MSGQSQGQSEEGPVSVNRCQAGQARKRSRPAGRAVGAEPQQEEHGMQIIDLPSGTASHSARVLLCQDSGQGAALRHWGLGQWTCRWWTACTCAPIPPRA
jgi:hypothetical protein